MSGSIGIPELLIIVIVLAVIVLLVSALFGGSRQRIRGSQSARLKELTRMKREGLITDGEFNEKKKEIIDGL